MSANQEELWVLALSASKGLLGFDMMFRGTANACMVHPRDIIRFICSANATSYIIAHNHPSGERKPSDHDWIFTRRLISCGELIEIPLIDHIVVTPRGHTSMAALQPGLFKINDSSSIVPDWRNLGGESSLLPRHPEEARRR